HQDHLGIGHPVGPGGHLEDGGGGPHVVATDEDVGAGRLGGDVEAHHLLLRRRRGLRWPDRRDHLRDRRGPRWRPPPPGPRPPRAGGTQGARTPPTPPPRKQAPARRPPPPPPP